MTVVAGSFTHPGSSSFSSPSLGFRPQWAIFMAIQQSALDTWAGSTAVGSLGFAAVANNAGGDNSIVQANYHEIWENGGVGGVWLSNNVLYLQTARDAPVDGWAVSVSSFDADGISFFSSITGSAAGKRIYYLAGDENFEEVAAGLFIPGSSPLTLGWRPDAFFGVGAGGGLGNPGYNTGFTDRSLATVVAGDWGEYASLNLETNGVWRGITDPNPNIQHWYGNFIGPAGGDIPILEDTITGGVYFSSEFTAIRTDISFLGDINAVPGFGNGDARLSNFILGTVDSIVGAFTPVTSVGVPTVVPLPFVPEAVVFFSPQEPRSGVSSQAVQGATGWGWCTEDDQALTLFGGHWNPPDPFQAASFQSLSRCWAANVLDRETMGSVGTEVTMGSARITDEGFEYTTEQHSSDAGEVWPVLYWAFAPVQDDPQFFRRV